MNVTERVSREIVELHQFFEDWFLGRLPQVEEAFARFSNHMAKDFRIIPPSGTIITLETLSKHLWDAHGNNIADFKIWIENLQVYQRSSFIYTTYEEWQRNGEKITRRVSTAIFEEHQAASQPVAVAACTRNLDGV